MNIISRKYTFSAGHRIEGHPKCGRLHGHNYVVIVTLSGELDTMGMVLDYAKMDEAVKPIIEAFDHRYIVATNNLNAKDPYAQIAMNNGDAVMPRIQASTAEELARFLFVTIDDKLETIYSVEVRETEKSSALYHRRNSVQGA